jgi:deferrochelatase/peroxidase EfeB
VSNLDAGQRPAALTAGADPSWMEGGTYMAFLRFRVDLRAWRALERPEQELVVGRDKLTGSGLVATELDAAGKARPVAAPPLPPQPTDAELADYRDPPQTADPLLEASHVHRANQNRASPSAPGAWRMFRQGYDFLDSIGPDGPLLGLNFVSFQADLGTLQHVLHAPGWLADVNFGGPARPAPGEPRPPALLALLSGGFYAVPPTGAPFPGAVLFDR